MWAWFVWDRRFYRMSHDTNPRYVNGLIRALKPVMTVIIAVGT